MPGRSFGAPVEDDEDAGVQAEPVEAAPAVDQALQVGHQHEVAGGFVVDGAAEQDLTVLTPEAGELPKQARQVEASVGRHEAQ
ncbi:hypothetical protein [Actinocorallia herbida]|uniref:hypothetical protein n=1 Tax=Actinocorallia herbida TaxID=58109 RepID=UPI0014773939|nr:hypothetical protein [Actinocorallia herbida]